MSGRHLTSRLLIFFRGLNINNNHPIGQEVSVMKIDGYDIFVWGLVLVALGLPIGILIIVNNQ